MPEYAEIFEYEFFLVPGNLQSFCDCTAPLTDEQKYLLFQADMQKKMSLKDMKSQIIQQGENGEILELLIGKKHIGLETPFCL